MIPRCWRINPVRSWRLDLNRTGRTEQTSVRPVEIVPIDRKKRIALYGGTFDPIHLGHLEVARKVSRLFEIDELWFVLARVAPHKLLRDVAPALHRYAMLALATQDEPLLL